MCVLVNFLLENDGKPDAKNANHCLEDASTDQAEISNTVCVFDSQCLIGHLHYKNVQLVFN